MADLANNNVGGAPPPAGGGPAAVNNFLAVGVEDVLTVARRLVEPGGLLGVAVPTAPVVKKGVDFTDCAFVETTEAFKAGVRKKHPNGLTEFLLVPSSTAQVAARAAFAPPSGAVSLARQEADYAGAQTYTWNAVVKAVTALVETAPAALGPGAAPGDAEAFLDRLKRVLVSAEAGLDGSQTRLSILLCRTQVNGGDPSLRALRAVSEMEVLIGHGNYRTYVSEKADDAFETMVLAAAKEAAKLGTKSSGAEMHAASKAAAGGGSSGAKQSDSTKKAYPAKKSSGPAAGGGGKPTPANRS